MSSIKGDNNIGGKRTDFERAAAHLLPEYPVQKKRLTGKRLAADILGVTVPRTGGSKKKGRASIGNSGVHLRYYKPDEYQTLNPEQKKELALWRINDPRQSDAQKKRKLIKVNIASIKGGARRM